MSFGDGGMTANRVVLVCYPHDQDDVESCRRVIEELRHDRLHTYKENVMLQKNKNLAGYQHKGISKTLS